MPTKDGLKRERMQRNFLTFEQGDIVVAVLPFSNQKDRKRRPALVVSGTEYLKASEDIILLQITSKQKPGKFRIPISKNDLKEGSLKTESEVKVDSPVTFHKELVEMHIGKITAGKLEEVKASTAELYGL